MDTPLFPSQPTLPLAPPPPPPRPGPCRMCLQLALTLRHWGTSAGVMSLWLVLLALTLCPRASAVETLDDVQSRMGQFFGLKSSFTARRQSRSDRVDLRHHRLFTSDPQLDCCPTITEFAHRLIGINKYGLLLELFHTRNFTQEFFETICQPANKDRPCQFIDRRYAHNSRCVQQYSYVYALGRTFGNIHEQFRIEHIRVATGCKCQLTKDPMSDNRIH